MRFSLYKFIHKPIRGQISALYIQSGKTAYYDFHEVSALHEQALKLSKFLSNHAMREDTFIRPELVNLGYSGLVELDDEHKNVEKKFKAALTLLTEIRDGLAYNKLSKEELLDKGYDFYLTLGDFAGAYLSHMITEERKVMPFLWEKLSDGALFEIFSRQDSTVTNEEVIETIHLMYPYLSLDEAVKLTGMLKHSAGDSFPLMVAEIKKCLEPTVSRKVLELSGVEEAMGLQGENPMIMFPSSPKKLKQDEASGPSVTFRKN